MCIPKIELKLAILIFDVDVESVFKDFKDDVDDFIDSKSWFGITDEPIFDANSTIRECINSTPFSYLS